MAQVHALGVAEASRLIARGELSPVEYTQALLDRIGRFDASVRAFVTPTPELALAQAREAEAEIRAGRWRGSLHGIPFALKDVIDTAGFEDAPAASLPGTPNSAPFRRPSAIRIPSSSKPSRN